MNVIVCLFGPAAEQWVIYVRFQAKSLVIYVVQWWVEREISNLQRRERRVEKVMRCLEGWIRTL